MSGIAIGFDPTGADATAIILHADGAVTVAGQPDAAAYTAVIQAAIARAAAECDMPVDLLAGPTSAEAFAEWQAPKLATSRAARSAFRAAVAAGKIRHLHRGVWVIGRSV